MELCGSFLYWIIGIFLVGYLGIIFEFYVKINKTALALGLAALCWTVYFLGCSNSLATSTHELSEHLGSVSQIIFFLLGAMTLVELIDSHKGFNTVISWIQTSNKRKLIFLISIISFFLSAVLDNLTTTILMISILRKLIENPKDRLLPGCMIVIAANAGGAWTPIGDVTTTMLWIDNRISTLAVMKEIFLPSLISMLIPLGFYLYKVKGYYPKHEIDYKNEKREPGSKLVFTLGVLSLVAVPIIKWATGLPPFMGIILAVGLLWFVTDLLHHKHEDRQHLRVPYILTKIDVSSILFFLGILLAINALESVGILDQMANYLNQTVKNTTAIASIIGVVSAIIDNVPLVAATMGMYDQVGFPMDSPFWLLIAYTAGTGGSMLSIGSAAGVALMGIEKVDFITYLKKATLPAAIGYAVGIVFYILF
jgi:NhaD family Na+/H+ antiporter